MKKIISSIAVLLAFVSFLSSQNLQLHYDFRHSLDKKNPVERNFAVATFEIFKPDNFGNTFLFVDFDFSGKKGNLSSIYAEIAREFQIKNFPLLPHVEFNGGIGLDYVIENAYLLGVAYPFDWGKFHFNSYVAYKYNNFAKVSHDAQFTLVWEAKLWNEKLSLCGFADLWSEDRKGAEETGKKLILYAEPQFWYTVTKHFAIGTELKISQHFYSFNSQIKLYPTLGIKYSFN